MRRSDAESDYNSLQLYATKRRGAFTFTASYTLGKVDHRCQRQRGQRTAERRAIAPTRDGPASFDRRHAFVGTFTYRVPFLRDRGDLLEAIGGLEVSGK